MPYSIQYTIPNYSRITHSYHFLANSGKFFRFFEISVFEVSPISGKLIQTNFERGIPKTEVSEYWMSFQEFVNEGYTTRDPRTMWF